MDQPCLLPETLSLVHQLNGLPIGGPELRSGRPQPDYWTSGSELVGLDGNNRTPLPDRETE